MKLKYEIHCVKLESATSSATIRGELSGHGISIGGSGASTTSGKTETIHTSHVRANNRLYEFRQSNASYPFREGDDMVFLCRKDKGTGKYFIESLLNNTNGTREVKSPVLAMIIVSGASLLVAAMLALFSLIVATPVFIFGLYYTFVEFPNFKRATTALLALEDKKDKRAMESVLTRYQGTYVIAGYE